MSVGCLRHPDGHQSLTFNPSTRDSVDHGKREKVGREGTTDLDGWLIPQPPTLMDYMGGLVGMW